MTQVIEIDSAIQSVVEIDFNIMASGISISPVAGLSALTVQKAIEELAGGVQTAAKAQFIFSQSAPSFTWVIPHNLGKYPAIQAFGPDFRRIGGVEEHVDTNNSLIHFNVEVSGVAYLN